MLDALPNTTHQLQRTVAHTHAQVAAVKAEASIEREAFVEKAREAAAEQAIVKQAGGSMMDLLGISSKDLGL